MCCFRSLWFAEPPYENACRPTCDVQEGCSKHTHLTQIDAKSELEVDFRWSPSLTAFAGLPVLWGARSRARHWSEGGTGHRASWNPLPSVTWAFSERVLLEEATRWPVLYPTEPHLEISPGRPHSLSLSLSLHEQNRGNPPAWGSDE